MNQFILKSENENMYRDHILEQILQITIELGIS